MPLFTGTLNTNVVFASLFNQVISMQVFDTGVGSLDGIYSTRKVDGTLYGDSKLYISTDVLESFAFAHTGMAYNLLTQFRPTAPIEEVIVIDQFRQIPVTVDDYLSKQAFQDEGSFAQFNSVILSWLSKTKEIYEHTKYTADIMVSATDNATALTNITLTAPAGVAGYDLIKWRAQELVRQIEDGISELGEPDRAFNDNSFLRTFSIDDFDIVVPVGILSTLSKHDVPYLFNPDGKPKFKEVHWKYFGTIGAGVNPTLGTERSLIEVTWPVSGTHTFPGDLIPAGENAAANTYYEPTWTARPTLATAGVEVYLIHKKDFPIMSAFSVGTSFFNAQNLTTNQYLTFGHNDVYNSHLGEYALLSFTTAI